MDYQAPGPADQPSRPEPVNGVSGAPEVVPGQGFQTLPGPQPAQTGAGDQVPAQTPSDYQPGPNDPTNPDDKIPDDHAGTIAVQTPDGRAATAHILADGTVKIFPPVNPGTTAPTPAGGTPSIPGLTPAQVEAVLNILRQQQQQ